MKYLYVTWDSPQVTYLESLFLPIFDGLRDFGFGFDVLQFTWGDRDRIQAIAGACAAAGIGYRPVAVRRGWGGVRPLLTAWRGARHILAQVRSGGADAILARSTMPALSTLRAVGETGLPFVFDADGLPLDERVEFAGRDPDGFSHRMLRDVEARAARRASAVLVRTPAARDIMMARAGARADPSRFFVVSNGRDPSRFAPLSAVDRLAARQAIGMSGDTLVLGYAGSVGPQYRYEEMLRLLTMLRDVGTDARLLMITPEPGAALELVRSAAPDQLQNCVALRAAPEEVPRWLGACDAGLALRTSSFSMQGVAPIKLAEYLLCGLPVVGTGGIGDTKPAEDSGVFFSVGNDDQDDLVAASKWLRGVKGADELALRARSVGVARFSVAAAVRSYAHALSELRDV